MCSQDVDLYASQCPPRWSMKSSDGDIGSRDEHKLE